MNYLQRLTEIKDKIAPSFKYEEGKHFCGVQIDIADQRGNIWFLPKYDSEFISLMRNSLDLWLELADSIEELSKDKGMIWRAPVHNRVRAAYEKLGGKK